MESTSLRPHRRIAFIGLGPRGLAQLERLLAEADRASATKYSIDLIEPHPEPGAGSVYESSQPACLLMNVPAHQISVWTGDDSSLPFLNRQTFLEWASEQVHIIDANAYVPRRWVGAYLQQMLDDLLAACPPNVEWRHIDGHAMSAHRTASGWRVICRRDPENRRTEIVPDVLYDEVRLAIGHQRAQPDPDQKIFAAHARTSSARYLDTVYPVQHQLDETAVPAGAKAIVRGIGLTAIDTVLALTEGRGGRFVAESDTDAPPRLRYIPSGREPAKLLLYSRSGRLPMPRPLEHVAQSIIACGHQEPAVWPAVLIDQAMRSGDASDRVAAIIDLLAAQTVQRWVAVRQSRGRRVPSESALACYQHLQRILRCVSDHARPQSSPARVRSLRRAVAAASGDRPASLALIAGEVWRELYDTIASSTSYSGLSAYQHTRFGRLAGYFEHLAFGPPVVQCERLLALIDAGIVCVDAAASPLIRLVGQGFHISGDGVSEVCPLMIRAQVDPPRLSDTRSELLRSLLQRGWIRPHRSEIGIDVTPDGEAIELDGSVAAGLYIYGRPTEGCVLGDDMLTHRRHRDAARSVLNSAPAAAEATQRIDRRHPTPASANSIVAFRQ